MKYVFIFQYWLKLYRDLDVYLLLSTNSFGSQSPPHPPVCERASHTLYSSEESAPSARSRTGEPQPTTRCPRPRSPLCQVRETVPRRQPAACSFVSTTSIGYTPFFKPSSHPQSLCLANQWLYCKIIMGKKLKRCLQQLPVRMV